MVMQIASKVPYHPRLCPQCQYYYQTIHRCKAFAVDSFPRPILAVFHGEADEDCQAFRPTLSNLPNTSSVEPVPEVSEEINTSEVPVVTVHETLTDAQHASTVLKDIPEPVAKKVPPPAVEARIHCQKCKSENPPTQVKCRQCGAKLLPAEGIGTRIGYFVGGLLGAGVFGYLAYLGATNPESAPMICQSPVQAGFISILSALLGIGMALRRTPVYIRYANRAERHVELNLPQALTDMSQAIELAPEKERADLISKRIKIFEKLGMEREALRDKLEYTLEPGAFQLGSTLTSFIGGDKDVYASGRGESERKMLLESGEAKAVGYCARCKEAVELTTDLRCPIHHARRPKDVRFVLADEVEIGKQHIYEEKAIQRADVVKRRRLLAFAVIFCVAVYYLVFKSPSTPNDSASLEQVQSTASQPVIAQETVFPATFNEQGVSYLYPSDWMLIEDHEIDTLVNTSLEGIGDYEYVGGVYSGGVENCLDCAQIVVVVVEAPVAGPLTDEQYQQQKAQAQDQMGARLIAHRIIEVSGIPVIESIHVGLSGETQLWELMWVEPGENRVYMLSCSAHVDHYADFEPVFAQAIESLVLDGVAQPATAELQPVPLAETSVAFVVGVVNQSSIRVRSGPGTTYNAVGGLSRGAEIKVMGRNEAADWVQIVDQEGLSGWVFVDLLTLSVPVESLPVVEAMP
jgi:Bacterial SH3 domain